MNIRKLYYLHRKFLVLRAWYFLIPAIIFALMAINGLRGNYEKMVVLRQAVYEADQNNGDVETALQKLRSHVYGHMNTNLSSGNNAIKPPIQLKARYERLKGAEEAKIKTANIQVAAQGEQVCSAQFPNAGFNAPRVACIQDYVAANANKTKPIPEELYKFDFVSPRWSLDNAGVSVFLTAVFLALFIARVALEKYMTKRLGN